MRLVEGRATIEDVDTFLGRLDAIGAEHGVAVQAFDARLVAGRDHLEAAGRAARRALDHDDAIADDPAVELLLYAAGRRQIDRALALGVTAGEGPLVVAVDAALADAADGDGRDAGPDEREAAAAEAVADLLEPAETLGVARDEAAIRERFGVSEAELGATDAGLEALVVERVALLAVEK